MNDRTPELALPDTKLFVYENEIIRNGDDDSPVLRLPINSIQSARMTRSISPIGIVTFAASGAITAIAYYVSESNGISILLYVVAVLAFAFGMLCIIQNKLVLKSKDQSHTLDVNESADIVQGFAASLNVLLSQPRTTDS